MKKKHACYPIWTVLLLHVCLLSTASELQNQPQDITATIEEVHLFLDGAQIHRNTEVAVNTGTSTLLFTGLSPKMLTETLRVKADAKDVQIIDVQTLLNEDKQVSLNSEILKIAEDSILLLQEQIADWAGKQEAHTQAKQVLMTNYELGGKAGGYSVREIMNAADLYEKRIAELNVKIAQTGKVGTGLTKNLNRLEAVVEKYRGAYTTVLIQVKNKTSTIVSTGLQLSYQVTDAYWKPNYNIHATAINKPMTIAYKAAIFNNTGIDWAKAQVTLMEKAPEIDLAIKPNLEVLNIDVEANLYAFIQDELRNDDTPANKALDAFEIGDDIYAQLDDIQAYTTASNNFQAEAFELEVAQVYSAPNRAYTFDLKEFTLPASYKYFTIPKVDAQVHLTATINDLVEIGALEGMATIYYKNTLVGNILLDKKSIAKELNVSLGTEPDIVVSRDKLSDKNLQERGRKSVKETLTYHIFVENKTEETVKIEIQDQVPVAYSENIVVEILDAPDADLDSHTGQLTWKYKLPKGIKHKIPFTYSVVYPTDK